MQQVLKDILSVKGLIMLIALVALGLSITAVVRKCDDFGNQTCQDPVGSPGACPSSSHGHPCESDSDCKDPYDCSCRPSQGSTPHSNGTTCTVKGQPCQKSSECCTQDSEGKTYNPELICHKNTCQQKGKKDDCYHRGKPCKKPDQCCSNNCVPFGDGNGGTCGPPETDEDEHHYYPFNPKNFCGTCPTIGKHSTCTVNNVGDPCFCKDYGDCIRVLGPDGLPPKKHPHHATGFLPSKNKGKDLTTSHSRTAKHPVGLGLGGNPQTWAPGSKVPPSSGGFPEWAIITLSSVGGVLLLGLVIYLLMKMKHGNKLM